MNVRAAALAVALAAACAGVRPAAPAWTFPDAFDATQVVSASGDGPPMELVASLRRRGGDYEVTLFDPVFGAPLLSAAVRGGAHEVREIGPAIGRAGEARRLLDVLASVYGRAYPAPREDATGASTLAYAIRLSEFGAPGDCAFPGRIDVTASGGARVEVRTLEVTCTAPGSRDR